MNTTAPFAARPPRLSEPRMVLVVEDDCAVRELFKIILEHQGYKVLAAGSAPEALAIVNEWRGEPIDLLITDLSMPCKNGDDLASELCALLPNLKVIFISGYSPEDPLPLSLNLHNAIYLPKPAGPHAVQGAIHTLFTPEPAKAA
jgi:two-component system, cell cycle sensor histidine kinase and response regulator CckA